MFLDEWTCVKVLAVKNHSGLNVRQAKNTNILLPNIEKITHVACSCHYHGTKPSTSNNSGQMLT